METLTEYVDITRLTTSAIEFLPKVLVALSIFVAFVLAYRATRRLLQSVMRRAGLEETLIRLLVENLYRYALLLVGLVMAADQLGINVAAALAGLGIAGIALGFAAQDSVANIISGIIIFWDKPFVVGDWICSPDFYGSVSNITLRSTRIRTPRNTFVVIPNKRIVDAVLENLSKHGELRIDVSIGIAYKEDVVAARRALLAAVSPLEHVRRDPPPDVVVERLGDSSVDLCVRVWIDDAATRQSVIFSVTEASKKALDAAGIEIPFPHLQVFLDGVKKPVWDSARALVEPRRGGA